MTLSIVQIGANRGNDDLTQIIRSLPSSNLVGRLVLVEPLSVHHETLRTCYVDYSPEILAVAIGGNEQAAATFYYHLDDGPLYEVASLDKAHIQKHACYNALLANDDRIASVTVPCITPEELLQRIHAPHPDILFLDCEGSDGDIVSRLLRGHQRPLNIYFENLHLKNDSVYGSLVSSGYDVVPRCLSNGWMSHASLRAR
jgi:FkbM family methyltransferase